MPAARVPERQLAKCADISEGEESVQGVDEAGAVAVGVDVKGDTIGKEFFDDFRELIPGMARQPHALYT